MRALPLGVAAAALALAGCGDDFVPFNRLVSLRVLAIQSEPVAPLTDESATLTPLVYTPPGAGAVSYEWSWCPFPGSGNDGYPCLVSEEEVRDLAGASADSIPPFDLGSDPTAVFDNSIEPDLLELLCEGTTQVPSLVSCEGGFPVQLRLTVRAGDQEVVTVRTLRLRFDPDSEPNANPAIGGLAAVVGDDEVELGDEPAVDLPRGEETTIRARVDDDAAEPYTGTGDDGEPVAARERLIFTWFIESGDTSDERTVFIDDAVALADASEVEWEPAREDDFAGAVSAFILVLRDDREGVSWRRVTAGLEDSP
jgi:hypothetical protein